MTRPLTSLALVPLVVVAAACDVPTPLSPADPIGEVPRWGEGFATPTQAPASMLGAGMGAGMAAGSGDGTGGAGAPPHGTKSPGDTGSWSGGDPAIGKTSWDALCASCHGALGQGGTGPSLADAKWQASVEDRQIARAVALGKGAMPGFMQQLDRTKLQGLVAYVRSLKKAP